MVKSHHGRYLVFHYLDGSREEYPESRVAEYLGDGQGGRRPERYPDFIRDALKKQDPILITAREVSKEAPYIIPTAISGFINTGLVKRVEVILK